MIIFDKFNDDERIVINGALRGVALEWDTSPHKNSTNLGEYAKIKLLEIVSYSPDAPRDDDIVELTSKLKDKVIKTTNEDWQKIVTMLPLPVSIDIYYDEGNDE